MEKREALRSVIRSIRDAEQKIADILGDRIETDRLIDQLLEVLGELDELLFELEEKEYQVKNGGEENFDEDYDDEWDGTDDEHGYECDCNECKNAKHEQECGEIPPDLGGGCSSAGSEYCDFECPFRNRVFGLVPDEDEDKEESEVETAANDETEES